MFKLLFTVCLLGSLSFAKPSEKDLVGIWKASSYAENGVSKDLSDYNISLHCTVEGKLGKLSGNTDKNFFSGLYTVKSKKSIEIEGFIQTKYKDSEETTSFINSFKDVDHFEIEQNELILFDNENNVKLFFIKNTSR